MVDLYDIGSAPPLGEVPRYMHAQVVRQSRYGEPNQAYKIEKVSVPDVGPGEVLVYVMATGINYPVINHHAGKGNLEIFIVLRNNTYLWCLISELAQMFMLIVVDGI